MLDLRFNRLGSPLRWRRTLVLIVASLVLVTGGAFWLSRPFDPRYDGKSLSSYLKSFTERDRTYGGVSPAFGWAMVPRPPQITVECSNLKAYDAIHSVGDDALPLLIEMLGSNDSAGQRWLRDFCQRHAFIATYFRVSPPRQTGSVAAFRELGIRAAPAIPGIIPLLKDPNCAMAAMTALLAIRPERESDILSLTNVLQIQTSCASDPVTELHSAALWAISSFGPQATAVWPHLLSSLNSTNAQLQATAAFALAQIGAPPNEIVPLILSHLRQANTPLDPPNPNAHSRGYSESKNTRLNLWALSKFGVGAQPALPLLTNLAAVKDFTGIDRAAREAMASIKGTK